MSPLLRATTGILAGMLAGGAAAQDLHLELNGQNPGANYGAALCAVPDLTGDGVNDVLVGAPKEAIGGALSGSVYLHSGADGSLVRRHDGAAGHRLGTSVAAFPDLDGDGVPDYAASAQRDNDIGLLTGYVRLWSGADGSLIREFTSSSTWDRFGSLVVAAGDVDADGWPDLLISAPQDDWQGPGSGAVRIYSGDDGALIQTHYGRDPWDLFGTSACSLGDIDGDGHGDFAIGSPRADTPAAESGAIQVYSGRTGAELLRIEGRAGDVFGIAVASVGDFDGDGLADLAGGGVDDFSSLTQKPGVVRVHSLVDGSELARFDEERNTEGFGLAVAGLSDGNGDGYGDLLIGAPHAGLIGGNGLASGSARLYSGLSGRRILDLNGDANQDHLGTAMAPAGDVNGDGLEDFLVGEPGDNPHGAVYLYTMEALPLISTSNLVAGQNGEIRTDGGDPGDHVDFFYSLHGFGETVYGSGISLDLESPAIQLGSATTDAAGVTVLPLSIPPGTTGVRVWFQAWHTGATLPGLPSSAATEVIG